MGSAADKKQSGLPSWLWTILIIVPGLIICKMLYWWLLTPSYRRKRSVEIKTPRRTRSPTAKTQEPVRDDLTRIKGIGPKTAEALNKAGVYSYTQLALIQSEKLEKIFREARARMTDLQSVHEQAKMAANQDWDGLEKFQKEN